MNESLLFEAIAAAVADTPISEKSISAEELEALYKIAKKHDLAHIVGYILDKNGLLDASPVSDKFKKQVYLALYRYQQLNHEFGAICSVLENEKIDYIPLKGSVIRDLYPEPWMRTSCDIDILIKREELERAVDSLVKTLNYSSNEITYHDISLFSESGVHLELHFNINENMKNIDPLLDKVWENSCLTEGTNHRYDMTPEFFVFHHIAHMSYHFVYGGCGIRPFIDLYLLRKKLKFNAEVLDGFLDECGLKKFYESVLDLSEVWIGEQVHNETTEQIEDYILRGGVYGSFENKVPTLQQLKGGKFKYILYKTFIPYEVLKYQYPVIQKHKWLTPIMHVRRWIRVLFKRTTAKDLKYNNNIDQEQAQKTKNMLVNIGLIDQK